MAKAAPYSEADLCAAFLAAVGRIGGWTAYPEHAGDILLVRDVDGLQIGIEAKLTLNPAVVCQILPDRGGWFTSDVGPNHRAVLVPWSGCNLYLPKICAGLGVTVIRMEMDLAGAESWRGPRFSPDLPPVGKPYSARDWHEWAPVERIKLPDYVPDVEAGRPSPSALTSWKIKAIKLSILLEERPVTRADFKHLELDPKLWLDPRSGWLTITPDGYVWREGRRRDFAREHPRNYAEIRGAQPVWAPKAVPPTAPLYPHLAQATLL